MKNAPMRILITGVMATLATSAAAETLTWGNLNIEYGRTRISNLVGNPLQIVDRQPESVDLSGTFGADFGQFGAQIDLAYSQTNVASDVYTGFDFGVLSALHLNYDVSSALTLGGQYGTGNTVPAADDKASIDFWALEGVYNNGPMAIAAQLGRFDSEDPDTTDTFHNGKFIQLAGLYSLGTAGVIQAEIGLFDGVQDTDAQAMDAKTWGLKYSRQLGANPFALSIGVDHGSYSNGGAVPDSGSYDETRFSLGFTTWFGDDDLAASKKRGILGQPDFARITVAGNNMD
jgi:phosphate-selective porin